jgi:malate dehydrogenase (quinone)
MDALVMEGRSETDRVAATSMTIGTDVNFGELTRNIFTYLAFRRCNDAF